MARISGVAVTTVSVAEIVALDGVTAGTVLASKAAVVDASKDIGDFRNLDAVNIDAGASGTAGTVDVFPTTASKGKLAITCTDQTGNTTVSLVAGAMAAARTITIPDPGAAASFVMSTGTSTATSATSAELSTLAGVTAGTVTASKAVVVDGSKQVDTLKATVGFQNVAVARTATADGLTTGIIADGTAYVTVTSANADHIITLPTPTPGVMVALMNGATGYELRSSAPATVAINGGAEADAESAITANTLVTCRCTSATTWICMNQNTAGTVAATQVAAAA
jgi:hypothetical protein